MADKRSIGYQERAVHSLSLELSSLCLHIRNKYLPIVTLPLERNDQDLFEKGPEKGPEKGSRRKSDEIEDRISLIYELMEANPHISRTEIAGKLDLTDKQVRRAINLMKKRNQIHRKGSARNGKWIVDNLSQKDEK